MSTLDDNLQSAFDRGLGWDTEKELDRIKSRHSSSVHMIRVLAPNPNLTGNLYHISEKIFDLGYTMFHTTPDGPELTAGLRKLMEAKDCFVRAALDSDPVNYNDR